MKLLNAFLLKLCAVFAMVFVLPFAAIAAEEGETAATGFFSFLDAAPGWLVAILGVLVALQGVAALTETKKDDEILAKIITFVRALTGLRPK